MVLGTTAYTSAGLVNSDSISGVTLKHGANTTVPVTQAAATYTNEIVASAAQGSGLSNYDITYVANTLTVNQKALTITADARSTTYGTALVLGTTAYTSAGLLNSDSISGVTLKHGANTTVPVTQAAATYTNEIVASAAQGSGLANYAITYAPNTLTVNKYVVSITAPVVTKEYDGNTAYTASAQDLNHLSGYLLNGDTVIATTMTYANKNVSANNKAISLDAITIANGQASNYDITLVGNASSSVTRLASATWVGGATGNWFNPANWAKTSDLTQTGTVPDRANVAAVVIPSGAKVTFNDAAVSGLAETATVNLNGLTGGALNITSGQLVVANNASLNGLDSSAGTTLTVGGTLSLNMASSGTVAGVIAGAANLVKSGAGDLTMSANNTYTGGTTVNTGTLFGGAGSLANTVFGSGAVTVNSGATLWLDRATLANDLVLNNAVLQGTNGFGEVFNGNITLTGTNEIRSYNYMTFNGQMSGSGAINKTEAGQLTLAGNNTYTGLTTIGAGTLRVTGALSDAAAVTVATGATYSLGANDTIASIAGAGNVNLNSYTLTVGNANSTTYSGVMSGSGALVKQGSGTLTLSGTNAYTGTTTINAGTLALSATGSIASSSRLVANGVFDISASTDGVVNMVSLSGSGSIVLGSNSLNITAANSGNFSGVISGDGDVSLLAGVQTFSGNNTYTGTTYLVAGSRLVVGHNNALGSTASGTWVARNATLDLDGVAVGNETINLNGGTLKDSSSSLAGNIILGGNSILSADAGNVLTLSGVISGAYGITKTGAGTVVLTGNNTYSGGTTINDGVLRVLSNLGSTSAGVLIANVGSLDLQTALTVGTLTMQNSASIVSGATSSLTVSGVANLMNSVTTRGAQTYQGAVHLAATTTITSNGGNVLFNGIVDAPSNSKATQVNLTVNAGAGSVTFNQQVGGVAADNNNYRNLNTNSDIYNLTVTAGRININADISTMQEQIYNGAIVIGDNGTNGATRTLLSLDPLIHFNGTVDDAVANTHTLVARAVAVNLTNIAGNPRVIFERAVGSRSPLYALSAMTGTQSLTGKAGDIDPITSLNPYLMIGEVIIKGSVSTLQNQTYVANKIGLGGTDPTLTLTTKSGKVNILVGKNANFGSNGGLRGESGAKFVLKYGASGRPDAATTAAFKESGLKIGQPVMGGFSEAAQAQKEVKVTNSVEIVAKPVVKVGEARVAGCDGSDSEKGKCSVK